ncbi:ChbG/HpnK family deacetylase [Desulfovibrio sp. X2]|uniref:ChbG/HpnK family deacetylase n=1 Tax=Desulfovibrio sp. X2 TaxID=941449 RepID=UPI00155B0707|nr:ChbG/HpnK family deacetylase [Desulfovibrio sp. X2]
MIVNADDFGLSDGICGAVAELMAAGAVTSTTVMTCADGAEERVRRHAALLKDQAGVHLQLTAGSPRLGAARTPSLVDESGAFHRRVPAGWNPDPAEVEAEWMAQVEALMAWGVQPTHLDGHHHIHVRPGLRKVLVRVARRFGLPVRAVTGEDVTALRTSGIACPDVFVRDYDEGERTVERFLRLTHGALERCGENGIVEIMVHPGLPEPELAKITSYAAERAEEWSSLRLSGARMAARSQGAKTTSYAALGRRR